MQQTSISIFKDLFKSTDVPYTATIEQALERIRVGKSKNLIIQIREGNKDLKKKLPSILFAGTFSERNGNGLVRHSGLMVVDFDKYPSKVEMKKHMELLKKNTHFLSLFISPGGNGIKGVVRVPELNKDTHPKYFKAFHKKFKYDYFDTSNSNVDRVCFESWDPDIFVNYDAEPFNPVIQDEGYEITERVPVLPVTDEDHIIERIMKWGWKKDFRDGERNTFIFEISGAFCEYGVSQSTAEGYILNNIVIGDFTEKEAVTAIKSAYKMRLFNAKYFEDHTKITKIKKDLKNGKKEVIKKYKIEDNQFEDIKEEQEHEDFWYYHKNKLKIKNLKYKWFLERNGFKKYFPADSQKPTWVSIKSNIVTESSVEKIKDFVLGFLINRGELEVWELCSNYSSLFSENFLLMLDSIELKMLRDSRNRSFVAFQNGILEITKDCANLIEYIDVDGYIWESQIIKRDFKKTENFKNDYKTFINNISNGEPLATECAIGYLLSTHKNKMNNKAIILNDEVISDNPDGGTGKGLFVQGLKQIRKVSILDGKTHDDKKSFPYQTVSQDCQILVLDDVVKNFNFEHKFSLVTEGITIERKNKDAIKLAVEDSPKMVITTNYAIKGEGNSHDRRRHELEIAQFYGENYSPEEEFGHQLFEEWAPEDFLKFDNYMVFCLQCFLKMGLMKPKAKNLKKRKFIAESSMEFFEWMEEEGNFTCDTRHNKQQAHFLFIEDYKDYQKLSRKKFNIWVQKYATFKGFKYSSGNSAGDRWCMIEKIGKNMEEKILDLSGLEF